MQPGTIVLTKKPDLPPGNALAFMSSTRTGAEEDIYRLKYVHMYNVMLPIARRRG